MSKVKSDPAKIEEFNPIDGQYFLITKNRKLLGKAWDLESARIIAAAFDQSDSLPLTLEELRGMDGEPVWVQDLLIPSCSAWHLVTEHCGEIWLFDALSVSLAKRRVGYNVTLGENYGKTWFAYRWKLEEKSHET